VTLQDLNKDSVISARETGVGEGKSSCSQLGFLGCVHYVSWLILSFVDVRLATSKHSCSILATPNRGVLSSRDECNSNASLSWVLR
jgi:hypothetical protein